LAIGPDPLGYVYNRGVPIKLREFRTADFDRLWELDQECFPPGIAYSRLELMHFIRRQGAATVIAECDGKIAGFTIGEQWRHRGHIVTLDVSQDFRRHGIGSQLIQACEEHFAGSGCGLVLLETAVNNLGAISFYKRHGYAVLKTIPRYYEGDLDALLMGKKLSAGKASATEG
jgi:[ribosomal protein S18]-alanine N-acetyltransferase